VSELATSSELLEGLNPQQRQAVMHTGGPVLVVAGAGSGKTRVLTRRIAYLLAEGEALPHQILAITFTNRAAREMRERVDELVGYSRGMWVLTFHATCGRILRRDADRLGYRSNFTIYDQADQVRLVRSCLEDLDRDPKRFPPRGIHSRISAEKNKLVSAAEFKEQVGGFFEQTVADVFELYEKRLHQSNAMDFDDLLVRTVDLLERFEDVRERWQDVFTHLLVDEYQDTNHAQYRIAMLLSGKHRNLFAVGDSDQSVYAFRGADIRNILDFERDFTDAATIRLEQNYRSTQGILDAANAVIAHNANRLEKRLWSDLGAGEPVHLIEVQDEQAEARLVAARIGGLIEQGTSAREIAVFYRTNAQSRVLEDLLVRHGVPYQVVGGARFYERAEIKDAMAYLQALDNPADSVSFRRIVNQPRRGIGASSIERLDALATVLGGTFWDAIYELEGAGLSTAADKAVRGFRTLVEQLRSEIAGLGVGEAVQKVLDRSGLVAALELERDASAQGRIEAGSRLENLQELVGVAHEYETREEEPTLSGFLQAVSLFSEADAIEPESGRVTLMTLHNAKGLEFAAVFVLGLEQNLFPHARSIEEANLEEERRLCYVAITRARERLTLLYARERTLFGQRGRNQPSQFLAEIPADIVVHERLGVSSLSRSDTRGATSYAAGRPSTSGMPSRPAPKAPRDDLPVLKVGDNVRHTQLGEGVVLSLDAGGQVVVRFRSDGSERRLLLAYAPLDRM
jgi:DNA helicase II / ATP-dependent DNA helicase PcrA